MRCRSVSRSNTVAVAALMLIGSSLVPATGAAALASSRLEHAIAVAAGRAAGTAASRAVAHAVLNGETRYRGPACRAGASALRLRGLKHAIFMTECRKVL